MFNLQGGFGKVYLAEQKYSKDPFAIKLFRDNFVNVHDVSFLYKEISTLAKLEHKCIIKLHTFCTTEENQIALILEYAAGGSLKDYLKEKPRLDEDEAREILYQILDTVNFCHEKGIIHRDIKLDNVVFANKQRTKIKIIDFGISGLFKVEKSRAGSLAYMPPEVIGGHNMESLPSIDVWGIGCMMYELLTGEKLFHGKEKEVKESIMKGKFVIPRYISLEGAHLLGNMLKLKPNERIGVNDALSHPWIRGEALTDEKEIERAKRMYQTAQKFLTLTQTSKVVRESSNYTSSNLSSKNQTRSHTTSKKDNMSFNKIPKLMTKIPSDIKESSIYQYHFAMMRKFKGNVSNFLQPIGHNKEQKQKIAQIRECFKNYYGQLTPKNEFTTANEETLSNFKIIPKGTLRNVNKTKKESKSTKILPNFKQSLTVEKKILEVKEGSKSNKILGERSKSISQNIKINSVLFKKSKNRT